MDTTFGPKLFEISTLHAVSAACKVKVKDTGDLLLLRDLLFEELGPPYMWTVMLSALEVPQETDRIFRSPSQSVFKNQGRLA